MTEQQKETLIEKIKKLFAMAQRRVNNDGSSNEAEAAAAMAKAQELLTKYNLDLKAVGDAQPKAGPQPVGGPRDQQQINRSAQYRWQREFWKNLAEANYCWHWVIDTQGTAVVQGKNLKRVKQHVKRNVILGSEANVAAVVVMGEYLTETIERLLPYTGKDRLSKSALSWREGCAQRLIERIRAKMEEMKREGVRDDSGTVTCTALAVQNLAQREYAANYDAHYGVGAWSRKLAREAQWEAERKQREAAWRNELAAQRAAEALARQQETPAQRDRRQAREQREAERAWRRYQREAFKEANRLDREAYRAGRVKAEDINLSDQLKKGVG